MPGGQDEGSVGQELDVGRMVELDGRAGRSLGAHVALVLRPVADEVGANHGFESPVLIDPAHPVVLPVEQVGTPIGCELKIHGPVQR